MKLLSILLLITQLALISCGGEISENENETTPFKGIRGPESQTGSDMLDGFWCSYNKECETCPGKEGNFDRLEFIRNGNLEITTFSDGRSRPTNADYSWQLEKGKELSIQNHKEKNITQFLVLTRRNRDGLKMFFKNKTKTISFWQCN